MHEVECVLLKEANIADPLEIAGGTPDLFIEDITNEQEEDEGSSLSIPLVEEILKPRRQKKEKEVVREEDLVAACDICFKRFRSGYGVRTHKYLVHPTTTKVKRRKYKKTKFGEKQYKCKICVYCSLDRLNFQRHMEKHQRHEEKFLTSDQYTIRCGECMSPMSSTLNLRHHMRIVHPVERFRCPVCSMTFKARQTLRRHLRNLHENEAPVFLKEIDDEVEKTRALKRAESFVRQKQQRKERNQRISAEKKKQKKLAKQKLEKKLKIKDEPEESTVMRVTRGDFEQDCAMNEMKNNFKQELEIKIKQEPEIEISEYDHELILS